MVTDRLGIGAMEADEDAKMGVYVAVVDMLLIVGSVLEVVDVDKDVVETFEGLVVILEVDISASVIIGSKIVPFIVVLLVGDADELDVDGNFMIEHVSGEQMSSFTT